MRQIAGDTLQSDSGESLKESIARSEHRALLEKQIADLERKIQLNRRMELHTKLKMMRKELEKL